MKMCLSQIMLSFYQQSFKDLVYTPNNQYVINKMLQKKPLN